MSDSIDALYNESPPWRLQRQADSESNDHGVLGFELLFLSYTPCRLSAVASIAG